jgi:cell division protein FtsB
MRPLMVVLALLVALIQYPLWLGKGGWARVWQLDRQVRAQKEVNRRLEMRNMALDAEVRDLKQGLDAIEERARAELGMVKQDEIFVEVVEPAAKPALAARPSASNEALPHATHP